MATGYVFTLDHVTTPISTPAVEADALYGDNGPENGPDPEYALVTSSETDTGRTTWNPEFNEDGSWDSGQVPVAMTLSPDGHGNDILTWTVNGETALIQTIPQLTTLSGVEIVAGTQLNASVAWSDLNVSFSDGTTTDAYSGSTASNPAVDTTTSSTATAEQELFVVPTTSSNTTLTISGNVDLAYPAGTYPGPNDLFASIYVYS